MKKAPFAALLLIACLNACVKDPSHPPSGSKGWLIGKVTELGFRETYSHDGILIGDNFRKIVHELEYNAVNKPILRKTYESPENDTSNLVHMYIDSLSYDAENRLTDIRRHTVGDYVVYGRRYIYDGIDTLPSVQIVYDSAGNNLIFTDTVQIRYYADKVVFYDKDDVFDGEIDSTTFYYPGGNLTTSVFNNNPPIPEGSDYDNAHNVERYFNVQHGLAFFVRGNYRNLARLSLNNWRESGISGYRRTLTYDERGLVTVVNAHSIGEKIFWISRFEYIARK